MFFRAMVIFICSGIMSRKSSIIVEHTRQLFWHLVSAAEVRSAIFLCAEMVQGDVVNGMGGGVGFGAILKGLRVGKMTVTLGNDAPSNWPKLTPTETPTPTE